MIILVGRPDTKTWWRNFRTDGDIDVLLQRRFVPMTARAAIGADDPDTIAPSLDAYLRGLPEAARALGAETNGSLVQQTVIVGCRPRGSWTAGDPPDRAARRRTRNR